MADLPTPYPPGAYPETPSDVGGASTPRARVEEDPFDAAGRALAIDGSGPSSASGVDKLTEPAPAPNALADVSPLSRKADPGPATPQSDGATLASAFLASEHLNNSSAAHDVAEPKPVEAAAEPTPAAKSESSGAAPAWTSAGAAAAAAFLAGETMSGSSAASKSSEPAQTPLDSTPVKQLADGPVPVADSSISSPTAALLHDHAPNGRDPTPPQPNAPTDDQSSIAAVRDMPVAGSSTAGTPSRGQSYDGAPTLAPALVGGATAGAAAGAIVYARQGSFPASGAPGNSPVSSGDLRQQALDTPKRAEAASATPAPIVAPQPTHSHPVVAAAAIPGGAQASPARTHEPPTIGKAKTHVSSPTHSKSPSRELGHGDRKDALAAGAVGAGAGAVAVAAHAQQQPHHPTEAEMKRDRMLDSVTHSHDPTAKYNASPRSSPRASTEHERPHKLHKAPVAPSARQSRDMDSPRKSLDSPRKSTDEGAERRGSLSWRRTRASPGAATASPTADGSPTTQPSPSKPKGLRRLSWRKSTENLSAKGEAVPPVPLLKSETPEQRQHRERAHAEKREPSHVEQVAKQAAMDPNAPAPGSEAYHHLHHHKMPPTHTEAAAARKSMDSPAAGRKSVTIDDRPVAEPEKERHGLSKLFHRRSGSKSQA